MSGIQDDASVSRSGSGRIAVTVLDYGIGNLLSVLRALEHCGAAITLVDRAEPSAALPDRLVLPGVGAFGDGMTELKVRGFDDLVRRYADTQRPFLGICVGLQMMFDASEEMGEHAGLGLLPGRVQAVPAQGVDGRAHRIPHIGWRQLEHPASQAADAWSTSILADVRDDERMYFVHSFAAVPARDADRLANVTYDGQPICAAVAREHLLGCQFHPERSGDAGLGVLRRFLAL